MRDPAFWWQAPSTASMLLSPLGYLYGLVAARNLKTGKRAELPVPVICVGNLTVGGAGKTPTAIALARAAIAMGKKPGFVSRGYKRRSRKPLLVDPAIHDAATVGDEPLLLARTAPTAVSANRKKAADLLIEDAGCDLVIMDDGFQSAQLRTDYALLVVDARRGLGNWDVFPAGPLRAPLKAQFARLSSVLLIGTGEAGSAVVSEAARSNHAVHRAQLVAEDGGRFAGLRVLAFAGIGDPQKFVESLKACGAVVERSRAFPDHHRYTAENIAALSAEAWKSGLQLVTTAKDAVRLSTGDEAAQLFLKECDVLDVTLSFDGETTAQSIVRQALSEFHRRRYGA